MFSGGIDKQHQAIMGWSSFVFLKEMDTSLEFPLETPWISKNFKELVL